MIITHGHVIVKRVHKLFKNLCANPRWLKIETLRNIFSIGECRYYDNGRYGHELHEVRPGYDAAADRGSIGYESGSGIPDRKESCGTSSGADAG